MHKYRALFQLLHLHVSVYMTILRVLIEYEHPENGHVDRNMWAQ
jgi:hypothetical protein